MFEIDRVNHSNLTGVQVMQEVAIKTQRTPNPYALKFILNRDVKSSGKVSYTDVAQCVHVPMAEALLELANVTQVHFFENVITVTQNGASDWEALRKAVESLVKLYIDQHDPHFAEEDVLHQANRRPPLSPELQVIDEIIERTIRFGLQADGGDIEIVELDGHILTIRYQGACGGCPSSMMGTLDAITSILRNEYDPELEVVAI